MKIKRLEKKFGGSVGVFRPLVIPASGTSPYTIDAAVNTERMCGDDNDNSV